MDRSNNAVKSEQTGRTATQRTSTARVPPPSKAGVPDTPAGQEPRRDIEGRSTSHAELDLDCPGASPCPGWQRLSFSQLDGWPDDNHAEALTTFLRSCDRPAWRAEVVPIWQVICAQAQAVPEHDADQARRFFEANFIPYRYQDNRTASGFLTGYYEVEVAGSRQAQDGFQVPLYAAPPDLVRINDDNRPEGWDPARGYGRRRSDGRLVPYWTRQQIEKGILNDANLELVYLADPVDAYFIHVQGSARLRLEDDTVIRVGFAAKNGWPYQSIGKLLSERYQIEPSEVTMQWIRAHFAAHPKQVTAITHQNPSFIFFQEINVEAANLGPIGAQQVALTAGRSLAIDRNYHDYGTPFWINGHIPDADGHMQRWQHMMIGQDTGSAIRGPARGDIFFGSGDDAGARAGRTQSTVEFITLLPQGIPPRSPATAE